MLTKKGNLKIGKVVIQRKGGEAGKDTANMLQFKFDPCLLFDLESKENQDIRAIHKELENNRVSIFLLYYYF